MSDITQIIKRYYLSDLSMPTEELIELREVCYSVLEEDHFDIKNKLMAKIVINRIDVELENRAEQHEQF
jgi:hypothetical protein